MAPRSGAQCDLNEKHRYVADIRSSMYKRVLPGKAAAPKKLQRIARVTQCVVLMQRPVISSSADGLLS